MYEEEFSDEIEVNGGYDFEVDGKVYLIENGTVLIEGTHYYQHGTYDDPEVSEDQIDNYEVLEITVVDGDNDTIEITDGKVVEIAKEYLIKLADKKRDDQLLGMYY